jgi:hypothetical protein
MPMPPIPDNLDPISIPTTKFALSCCFSLLLLPPFRHICSDQPPAVGLHQVSRPVACVHSAFSCILSRQLSAYQVARHASASTCASHSACSQLIGTGSTTSALRTTRRASLACQQGA